METLSTKTQPPCEIDPPANLIATPGKKKSITLSWDPVDVADGYHVYLVQNRKYAKIATTTNTTYKDTKLTPGQTYCYVVTAYRTCPQDDTIKESVYSIQQCATAN